MTGARGTFDGIARPEARRRLSQLGLRGAAISALLLAVAIALGIGGGIALAAFTASRNAGANTFTAGRIFTGTWSTPAFKVGDASSGTEVDASSPIAFAGDGLTTTTKSWSSAFSAGRYVQVDLNAPLPGGLAVTGATFDFSFASSAAGVTSCVYIEVRRQSTGAVVATYGSSGSPLGCVTGTTMGTVSAALAALTTTDLADDLRIRVFASNSASSTISIDRATVSGSHPYVGFTLYPVVLVDAADSVVLTTPWGLSGP